jgi:RNA 3'-terminal phosphate cyclase-like protein
MILSLFAKNPVEITLKGVTNSDSDLSVDVLRVVSLPLLKRFGIDSGLSIKVNKRGCLPNGGGEVFFSCPIVKELKPIRLTEVGKIKRVRGLAYTAKVNPAMATRVIQSSRELLNEFIPDVWVYTDNYKGPSSGASPGYGESLIAESTTGCLLSAEKIGVKDLSPEDMGSEIVQILLDEIAQGGAVDSAHQALMFVLMTLCPEDVSTLRIGKLTPYS